MDALEVDEMTGLEEYLMDTLESVVPEADECGDREVCNLMESVVPLEEGSMEPYVGMEFSTKQMAYDFYNTYGFITGFSIRTSTFNKNVKGVITSVRLVCSKQGFAKGKKRQMEEPLESVSDTIVKTPEKQTSLHRCGCKASCTVRLHEDGKWRVSTFYKEHNHAFVQNTPSKKRHLRSHKQISMKERVEIEILNEQNVGSAKIREYLAVKAGGRENLHYSKKDVSNQIGKAKKKRRPERFKRPIEVKDAKKMRTCSYCHRKEGHNMRKCPKKKNDEKLGLGQAQELSASEEEYYNEDDNADYNEGDNSYDSEE